MNYNQYKKMTLKSFLLIGFIYFFVFKDPLEKTFSFFGIFDELVAILGFICLVFLLLENKIITSHKLLLPMILLVFFGLITSFKNDFEPAKAIFADVLIVLKFWLSIIFGLYLSIKINIKRYYKKISLHINLILLSLFILTIFNYIVGNRLFHNDYRYGIVSNKLFYSHQTFLVAAVIFLIALLMLSKDYNRYFKLSFTISIFILVSTLRTKAFIAVIISILLYYFNYKKHVKFRFKYLILLIPIILLFSWNQIYLYFFSKNASDTARNQLLINSFNIAKDYFPFGTGFASFGSYMSGLYYSKVYYVYHMNNIWGLSPDYYSFVADSFWPMILGQFGYIGLMLYLFEIISLYKIIHRTEELNMKSSAEICFIYLLISSTSESAFANPMSISLGVLIGICLNSFFVKKQRTKKETIGED